eukprot:TRINITY_DN18360_c0_g1_i1.p1 TRINITY_DN18360_c0_g1~~TRINITY_DN18360_c0_g1_i1.p1  ORF type:complete len:1042 (-),score=180.40 TRINITY_DN18360_c0_g1_i1:152-2977(-)
MALLGEGGLATVFLAVDMTGGLGSVAVKVLKWGASDRSEAWPVYLMHREAQWSLQYLHNEGDSRYDEVLAGRFVKYLEDHTGFKSYGTQEEFEAVRSLYERKDLAWNSLHFDPALPATPYVVMELAQGQPLLQAKPEETFSADERRAIVRQAAEALVYLQRFSLVHRDFRSSNMHVARRGAAHCRLHVMDLGLTISAEPGLEHNDNMSVQACWNKPGFQYDWVPPEVLSKPFPNFAGPSYSFDVFSLAVLLLRLFAGKRGARRLLQMPVDAKLCQQMRMLGVDAVAAELVCEMLGPPSSRPSPSCILGRLSGKEQVAEEAPPSQPTIPKLMAATSFAVQRSGGCWEECRSAVREGSDADPEENCHKDMHPSCDDSDAQHSAGEQIDEQDSSPEHPGAHQLPDPRLFMFMCMHQLARAAQDKSDAASLETAREEVDVQESAQGCVDAAHERSETESSETADADNDCDFHQNDQLRLGHADKVSLNACVSDCFGTAHTLSGEQAAVQTDTGRESNWIFVDTDEDHSIAGTADAAGATHHIFKCKDEYIDAVQERSDTEPSENAVDDVDMLEDMKRCFGSAQHCSEMDNCKHGAGGMYSQETQMHRLSHQEKQIEDVSRHLGTQRCAVIAEAYSAIAPPCSTDNNCYSHGTRRCLHADPMRFISKNFDREGSATKVREVELNSVHANGYDSALASPDVHPVGSLVETCLHDGTLETPHAVQDCSVKGQLYSSGKSSDSETFESSEAADDDIKQIENEQLSSHALPGIPDKHDIADKGVGGDIETLDSFPRCTVGSDESSIEEGDSSDSDQSIPEVGTRRGQEAAAPGATQPELTRDDDELAHLYEDIAEGYGYADEAVAGTGDDAAVSVCEQPALELGSDAAGCTDASEVAQRKALQPSRSMIGTTPNPPCQVDAEDDFGSEGSQGAMSIRQTLIPMSWTMETV